LSIGTDTSRNFDLSHIRIIGETLQVIVSSFTNNDYFFINSYVFISKSFRFSVICLTSCIEISTVRSISRSRILNLERKITHETSNWVDRTIAAYVRDDSLVKLIRNARDEIFSVNLFDKVLNISWQ